MRKKQGMSRELKTEENQEAFQFQQIFKLLLFRSVVLNLFFHRAALLWSKCKSHGPHACHLHITSSIQTN